MKENSLLKIVGNVQIRLYVRLLSIKIKTQLNQILNLLVVSEQTCCI